MPLTVLPETARLQLARPVTRGDRPAAARWARQPDHGGPAGAQARDRRGVVRRAGGHRHARARPLQPLRPRCPRTPCLRPARVQPPRAGRPVPPTRVARHRPDRGAPPSPSPARGPGPGDRRRHRPGPDRPERPVPAGQPPPRQRRLGPARAGAPAPQMPRRPDPPGQAAAPDRMPRSRQAGMVPTPHRVPGRMPRPPGAAPAARCVRPAPRRQQAVTAGAAPARPALRRPVPARGCRSGRPASAAASS